MRFQLNKQIEALLIGPLVSEQVLRARLEALASNAGAIYGIVTNLNQVASAATWLRELELDLLIAPIAYPLGNLPWEIKALQARQALADGAQVLDFVLPIEHIKSGELAKAAGEVASMHQIAIEYDAALSCIVPLALLSAQEQQDAAQIAQAHGAALKTATGLGTNTSLAALQAFTQAWSEANPANSLDVVACGEIHLFEEAYNLLQTGARRVCSPEPEAIIAGQTVLYQHELLEG